MIEVQLDKTLMSPQRCFRLQLDFACTDKRLLVYGPSGSGKSLLLQLLGGLQTPDAGVIRLAGRTLFDAKRRINVPARQRRVAYLFQDYALFPHLTARQNIAFGLRRGLFNPERNVRDSEVDVWLERFALHEAQHLYPHQLSGGQRQRTALARALIMRPAALLLDEPFSALDPALREHMRQQLAELQSQLGIPMVIISHDPCDLEFFTAAVVHIEAGRLAGQSNLPI